MICLNSPIGRQLGSGLTRYWVLSTISYSVLQYILSCICSVKYFNYHKCVYV